MEYEISTSKDGLTLWVNSPETCLGRFSKRFGIDVHRSNPTASAGSHCLFCTHEPAGAAEWAQFRAVMLKHHGIDVPVDVLTFLDKRSGAASTNNHLAFIR